MKLTQKKITYRKNKNNPVAQMLKDPEFRQQKVVNKKIYDRKDNNAGLLKMLGAIYSNPKASRIFIFSPTNFLFSVAILYPGYTAFIASLRSDLMSGMYNKCGS